MANCWVQAKKFLAQKSIQHIVDGICKSFALSCSQGCSDPATGTGDIVFWETLSSNSTKQAKAYRKDHSDPFCRLRVPLYLKVMEVVFFAAFLCFYYAVLVQRPTDHITVPEVMLYVWLVSFTYNGTPTRPHTKHVLTICRICRVFGRWHDVLRNRLLGFVGRRDHSCWACVFRDPNDRSRQQ